MTIQFKDTFWTSDYITGIKALFDTLESRSLDIQHSLDTYQTYTTMVTVSSGWNKKRKHFKGTRDTVLSLDSKTCETFLDGKDVVTFNHFNESLENNYEHIANSLELLAVDLKDNVVIRLHEFLDDYKDFIKSSRNSLQFQYNQYIRLIQSCTTIEKKLISRVTTLENAQSNSGLAETSQTDINQSQLPSSTASETSVIPKPQAEVKSEDRDEDDTFKFPLTIGSTVLQTLDNLSDLLYTMIDEIKVKRRLIPLPGVNNEYFASEELVKWVRNSLPDENTLLKLEKFGQDLLDLNLITPWNKISVGRRIFASDSGYYEFTDLTRFIAKFNNHDEESEEDVDTNNAEDSAETSEIAPSAASSSIWSSIKNPFTGTPADPELLKKEVAELNEKYINELKCLNLEKATLEQLITSTCVKAQTYETNRDHLLILLNEQLVDKLISHHQAALQSLQELKGTKLSEDTVQYDLLQSMTNSKGGWFWPTNELRYINHMEQSHNCHLELIGVDLVNLALDYNEKNSKWRSLPVLIKSTIEYLDAAEGVDKSWTAPLDLTSSNRLKNVLLSEVVKFSQIEGLEDQASAVKALTKELCSGETSNSIVNFFKLWLLELPDSVVPFTCYDSLLRHYSRAKEDKEQAATILGTIPRQNLATLLAIMNHIVTYVTFEDLQNFKDFPFHHLILRHSPRTNTANVDDFPVLSHLVEDLYDARFREILYLKLEELERNYDERIQIHEQKSIASVKADRAKAPVIITVPANHLSSPRQDLDADGLRPFRTKSPNQSPLNSPNRNRSRSNSHLSGQKRISINSNLLRPSDNLSKRNSMHEASVHDNELPGELK